MAADDVPFKAIIPIIYCNFMADSIIIRTNKTKRNENDSLRFVRFFVKFFIEKNERNERIGTFANPDIYAYRRKFFKLHIWIFLLILMSLYVPKWSKSVCL